MLALLSTALLPALARSGTLSRTFQCLNNLRQLTLAWREYTEDNQDKLLYASSDQNPPRHNPLVPAWVGGEMDYNGGNHSNWDPAYDIFQSPMWPYCTNAYDIWRCPSDPSYVIVNGVARPRVRSISMNVYLGGFAGTDGGWGWATQFRLFLKATDLTTPGPAQTFVFLEMRPDSINWPDFQTEMSGYPDQPALYQFNTDYPNMLHDLACNFSFADGHAETHHWLDPRTAPAFGPPLPFPANAVPGDPDIAWLQDHATRPK
jgi:prepilin-type processing-associated H-X9-DG protein